MIFWVILFILVILVSFILAIQSMRNFHEIPQASDKDYGIFLIRKTYKLTADFLDRLHVLMSKEELLIGFERLFKGHQSTLLIFTPRKIARNNLQELDLVEIEDYTNVDDAHILGFEMGKKSANKLQKNSGNFFTNFPNLEGDETLWWQLVLKTNKGGIFEVLPRVVISSKDSARRAEFEEILKHSARESFLTKIPKPYTISQMLKFYRQRNFEKSAHNPNLQSNELIKLILLN